MINLWNNFIDRQECIKCECEKITSYFRPYCKDCYIKINNKPEYIQYSVDKKYKKKSRRLFNWLKDIPEGLYKPCHLCDEKSHNDIWFYGYRSICLKCFNEECDKRDIPCAYIDELENNINYT